MADGVLTSSLEPTWYKLFFGTLAMPKNRGACVDPQNWHSHKISIGYIKTNSNLWLEVTLECLSPRRSRWIWRWSKTELGLKSYDKFRDAHVDTRVKKGIKLNQDGLWWNLFQHESCASRRNDWFWYKNRLNPSLYAICGGKIRSETEAAESFRTDRVDLIGETELVRKFTGELARLTR